MTEEIQPNAEPETTPPTEDPTPGGNGAPDLDAARKALLDSGYNVLDSKALEKRLAKERAKVEAQFADHPEIKEALDKAKKRLQAIEDKDKGELEILKERQAEWNRINAENAAKVKDAEERAQKQIEANREILRDVKLAQLLTNSADPELAHLAAMKDFPTLTTNDDRELVYTDKAGVEYVGKDAEERINSWWASKEILHSSPHPGPPTRGGTKPGQSVSSPLGDEPPEHYTFDERIEWARQKDAEDAAMRRRQ